MQAFSIISRHFSLSEAQAEFDAKAEATVALADLEHDYGCWQLSALGKMPHAGYMAQAGTSWHKQEAKLSVFFLVKVLLEASSKWIFVSYMAVTGSSHAIDHITSRQNGK